MSHEDIPIINAEIYMEQKEGWEAECKKVAESFHKYGIVKLKDPRVNMGDNDKFIDIVEKYFDSVSKKYYAGEELKDMR